MESKGSSPESILGKQVSSIQTARRSIPLVGINIRTIASIIVLGLLGVGSIQNLDWYIDGIKERENISVSTTISSQTQTQTQPGKTEDTKDQQMLHNDAGTDNDIESCLRPKSNSARVAKLKPPCEFTVFRT